jgi:VanZ family protein
MKIYTEELKFDIECDNKPELSRGWFVISIFDVIIFSIVVVLAFLSISKSIGYAHTAAYVEALVGSDKTLHLIAGFILPIFILRISLRFKLSSFPKSIFFSCLFATLIMLTDEGLQYFNPNRHVSIEDLIAGFSGLLISLIFLAVIAMTTPKYK